MDNRETAKKQIKYIFPIPSRMIRYKNKNKKNTVLMNAIKKKITYLHIVIG